MFERFEELVLMVRKLFQLDNSVNNSQLSNLEDHMISNTQQITKTWWAKTESGIDREGFLTL